MQPGGAFLTTQMHTGTLCALHTHFVHHCMHQAGRCCSPGVNPGVVLECKDVLLAEGGVVVEAQFGISSQKPALVIHSQWVDLDAEVWKDT